MSAVACACESSLLSQTTLSPNLFKKNINFENVFLLWEWVSFCFLNSRTNILGTTTLYEIRSICCVGAFSRVIDVFGGGEKGGKADAATFSDGEKENPSLLPFFPGGSGGGQLSGLETFGGSLDPPPPLWGSGEKLFPPSVVVAPPPILSVRRKRRDSTEILSAVSKFRTYLAFMWESTSCLKLFSYFCQGLVKYSFFLGQSRWKGGRRESDNIGGGGGGGEKEEKEEKEELLALVFPSLSFCLSTFVTN